MKMLARCTLAAACLAPALAATAADSPTRTVTMVVPFSPGGPTDALKQPELRRTLLTQGLEIAPSISSEQLGHFIQTEVTKWRAVVKSSGAEID